MTPIRQHLRNSRVLFYSILLLALYAIRIPFYPLISAAVCLAAYVISRITHKLQTGMIILTSGICLVVLLSTMVTLTSGQMPVFMLAEPVVLLVAVTAFVICIVKAQKPSFKTKNNVQD